MLSGMGLLAPERLDVLVVCTGNVCRSPYIAAQLAAALPSLAVGAAGTHALVGTHPDELLTAVAKDHGVTADLPPGRQVRRRLIRHARLIVTAAGEHRAHVIALDRDAMRRTFTLLELARVLEGHGAGLGVEGVVDRAWAAAQSSDRDHDDDLVDPYGLAPEDYARMADAVDAALSILIPALRTPA